MSYPITVLDIGARSGFQPIWDTSVHPVRVIGFEPDLEECSRLNSGIDKSAAKRVDAEYYPVALAGERGRRTLYLFEDRRLSSFYIPNELWLARFPLDKLLGKGAFEIASRVELDCMTLDEFAGEHLAAGADFIKLDTQGSELEILKGGSHLLENVFAVCTEVEFEAIYENQPLFADVDSFLRGKGFTLFDLNRHWWKRAVPAEVCSRGQMVFADALYLRDYWNPSNRSGYWSGVEGNPKRAEKIVALASVLGYSDYALQLTERFENIGTFDSSTRASLVSKYIEQPAALKSVGREVKRGYLGRVAAKISRRMAALGSTLETEHAKHLNREFYDNDERKSFRCVKG